MELKDFKQGDLIAIAYTNWLWYGIFYKYTGKSIQYFDGYNNGPCKQYVNKCQNRIVKISEDVLPKSHIGLLRHIETVKKMP